jgi:hypothetical protein
MNAIRGSCFKAIAPLLIGINDTLDNTKNATGGINSQLRQDLAGLGGDVKFLRTSEACC